MFYREPFEIGRQNPPTAEMDAAEQVFCATADLVAGRYADWSIARNDESGPDSRTFTELSAQEQDDLINLPWRNTYFSMAGSTAVGGACLTIAATPYRGVVHRELSVFEADVREPGFQASLTNRYVAAYSLTGVRRHDIDANAPGSQVPKPELTMTHEEIVAWIRQEAKRLAADPNFLATPNDHINLKEALAVSTWLLSGEPVETPAVH